MALSPSGSSKRACSEVNTAVQAAACVVDGCTADLGNCRKYHQRHKVCEVHSKSPEVSIKGQQLRFCQQCSRFHTLDEFDEGKRSCRKRLDGHNRRRRKPRPYVFHAHHGIGTGGGAVLPMTGPPAHTASMDTTTSSPWSRHLDHYAPSLLSSSSEATCTTFSHVVHPSSSSSISNPLDSGLSYGGLENHYEDPQTLPFYWQY